MRRTLAITSIACLAVAALGVALLMSIGVPAAAPGPSIAVFVLALLGLIGGIITGVFAIVLPRFGRAASAAEIAEAAAAGREGLARVLSARPTGSQINGAYVYDAELVVDQTRVPAYAVTDRIRVHRADGTPRAGDIVSVVRLREDAPQVVVIAGPARSPQDALVPREAPPWS